MPHKYKPSILMNQRTCTNQSVNHLEAARKLQSNIFSSTVLNTTITVSAIFFFILNFMKHTCQRRSI